MNRIFFYRHTMCAFYTRKIIFISNFLLIWTWYLELGFLGNPYTFFSSSLQLKSMLKPLLLLSKPLLEAPFRWLTLSIRSSRSDDYHATKIVVIGASTCYKCLWTLLLLCHLTLQSWLQSLTNLSNSIRIVKPLVPLVAHTSTSFVGLTHSNSFGPWVLDSSAIGHIIDNKSFFSSLSTLDYLPSISMANRYRISSHGLVLFTFFPHFQLIMLFMSLCLPLTYYPFVVSYVPLITLSPLQKILFAYRTRVRIGYLTLNISLAVFIIFRHLNMLV